MRANLTNISTSALAGAQVINKCRLLTGPANLHPGPFHFTPVMPTGRNFGRNTQKWPHKNLSGLKKLRPIRHQKPGENGRKVAGKNFRNTET
jgi:hypothetical protein